jgi:hypothetical protein
MEEKEQSPSNHVWCHCVTIDYNITSLVTSSILKKIMRNYRPVSYCSYMKLKIKQRQIMLWWCFCMVFSEEIRYWSESGWWLISPDSAPWIHRSCSGLWPTRNASCHNGGCTEKINTIQMINISNKAFVGTNNFSTHDFVRRNRHIWLLKACLKIKLDTFSSGRIETDKSPPPWGSSSVLSEV